jgi:GAF domain-containing protein
MPALAADDVVPFDDWHTATRASLTLLHRTIGLDVWMVTQVQDARQVVVHSHPEDVIPPGAWVPWISSYCRLMVTGAAPRVATVAAATPAYRDRTGHLERIAAYIGVPLVTRDGALFGSLCGISSRAQPRSLAKFLPLVEMTARMLSTLLPPWPDGQPAVLTATGALQEWPR